MMNVKNRVKRNDLAYARNYTRVYTVAFPRVESVRAQLSQPARIIAAIYRNRFYCN